MHIDIPLLDLVSFFLETTIIAWVLTLTRTLSGNYKKERYRNCSLFSVFCMGVVCVVAILTRVYNPPEVTSLKINLPGISSNNALFYVLGIALVVVALYHLALLPPYRAVIESDEAKDKRFGTVPTKED